MVTQSTDANVRRQALWVQRMSLCVYLYSFSISVLFFLLENVLLLCTKRWHIWFTRCSRDKVGEILQTYFSKNNLEKIRVFRFNVTKDAIVNNPVQKMLENIHVRSVGINVYLIYFKLPNVYRAIVDKNSSKDIDYIVLTHKSWKATGTFSVLWLLMPRC